MRIVIALDASTISKFVLREEGWKGIEQYLEEGPHSLDYSALEAANAIWKEHMLRKKASEHDAKLKLDALLLISASVLVLEPLALYAKEGLDIAIRERISVYDAAYIAQAKHLGTLVTSDYKQSNVAERLGIKTIYVK